MPTYDYECRACGHRFEEFQSITEAPLTECPSCGGEVRRLIGSGAGILFKGSGFYQTDYRSESYRKAVKAEQGGSSPKDGAAAGKSGPEGGKSGSKSGDK